ncbi:unnamed protein product [Blepharisma stoltei]|uniref:Uncharacterized protein n=1 Tax=Blepharisma stoltei TaxID=1481888 RepID=A0AAU9IXL0_9CILI|nr:unnamed protein product [Blepharisma stoltei]
MPFKFSSLLYTPNKSNGSDVKVNIKNSNKYIWLSENLSDIAPIHSRANFTSWTMRMWQLHISSIQCNKIVEAAPIHPQLP